MPEIAVPAHMKPIHAKAECLYDTYFRKGENPHQTHYCPGCGHGVALKLLAEAIDELGIADRVIVVSPVGCSVFLYYYFDTGNVQVAHGRAPAAATGLKRANPEAIVIAYQGDGDLAAIGSAEILHAANRGEPITCIFVNNAIYGMTGGQMAPTTPLGGRTTTTPFGRAAHNDGYPLHVSEVLAALDGPAYIERVALGNVKQILGARRAIRKALETQMKGLGFSLVEVLSPCPTIWKMDPVEAQRRVREEMTKLYPLGVKCDRTAERQPLPAPAPAPPLEELPRILQIPEEEPAAAWAKAEGAVDCRIRVAGFGGQGVLLLGQLLAEAGMDYGLEVSWLPSYGPEMRSGTSNCHVRLSSKPIDSPLVSQPHVLIALNEPSLRKFVGAVQPGGVVLYNGTEIPADARRGDVAMYALPFFEIADREGSAKAGNLVALGALLEAVPLLPAEVVDRAMARVIRSEKWLELDRRALKRGREALRALKNEPAKEPCHA
ncbi:MAG: 2-oxoacid:acceptor oxidoreductase family protein [Bryobacteraceae bacterium]|nr:2-oxoacid:acceptor oxidoreductase family protein [Bryobacteraceae bacterium]